MTAIADGDLKTAEPLADMLLLIVALTMLADGHISQAELDVLQRHGGEIDVQSEPKPPGEGPVSRHLPASQTISSGQSESDPQTAVQ